MKRLHFIVLWLWAISAGAHEISVLSLNVYGVPRPFFKNPKFQQRVDYLCQTLKDSGHPANQGWDIILLQEVLTKKVRKKLKHCGYPYVADINRKGKPEKFMQTGLMILSRYPILHAQSVPYKERGTINGFESLAERIVRRSLLLAVIQVGEQEVLVGDTHLAPNFESTGGSSNRLARTEQMKETAQLMREHAAGRPFILGGDFNFGPVAPSYEPLWDEITQFFPEISDSFDDNIATTYDADNLLTHYPSDGKLDHIFASNHFDAEEGKLALTEVFTLREKPFNYSDHYGWQRRFRLNSN